MVRPSAAALVQYSAPQYGAWATAQQSGANQSFGTVPFSRTFAKNVVKSVKQTTHDRCGIFHSFFERVGNWVQHHMQQAVPSTKIAPATWVG